MTNIAGKVKDKLKDAKDTVVGSKKEDTEGTGYDSTKQYESNEPMSPAKIKGHEPTAVKREMTENITGGKNKTTTSSTEEAREKARRSGMTKGTAGAEE
jgi:hypothetical protein